MRKGRWIGSFTKDYLMREWDWSAGEVTTHVEEAVVRGRTSYTELMFCWRDSTWYEIRWDRPGLFSIREHPDA